MTNREKYKQAFSVLHTSDAISLEVEKMNIISQKRRKNHIAAGFAACLLLVASAATAYAADIGGIQRTVQVWIDGDQTTAVLEVESPGTYRLKFQDAEGNDVERSGGGVAIEPDGTERPLTEEELLEELNSPDVQYKDDGTVWLYYQDQVVEITDKFEDGVCYTQLKSDEGVLYLTIEYKSGFSISPNKYIDPVTRR